MSTQVAIQIPEEVKALCDTVVERWGYHIGYKATRIERSVVVQEMNDFCKAEAEAIKTRNAEISLKLGQYFQDGTDIREDVLALQEEIGKTQVIFDAKRKPFKERMKPHNSTMRELRESLKYLDDTVIPAQIRDYMGTEVKSVVIVSPLITKAIKALKASKSI